MISLLVFFTLALMLPVSIWLRMCWLRQQAGKVEPKASPLSLAVQELLAAAGGIYLSLIMLLSFLKIDVPEKILLLGVVMDPLPCLAIGLAIVQPLVMRLFNKN